jgi:hypothetical protein
VTWEQLEAAVRRLRTARAVTMLRIPRPSNASRRDAADALVLAAGYRAIGAQWISLSRADARAVLLLVLERSLAYNVATMSRANATELADAFLEHAQDAAVFFTNGDRASGSMSYGESWTPLTEATFDGGLVAVDGSHAAMLWIEDED